MRLSRDSLYAREKLPQPLAVNGVVVTDVLARTLGVRLSELANGYSRMWWKTAHTALKAAAENGWSNHPFVWASIPGARQVAHVQPADFSMLSVHFPVGTAGFAELISRRCQVSQPRLTEIAYSDEVFREIAEASQRHVQLQPWWSVWTLRPTPLRPSARPSTAASGVVKPVDAPVVTEPPVGLVEPKITTQVIQPEIEPVWRVLLDVSVWRSHPWWWRLAASLVVKRLGR